MLFCRLVAQKETEYAVVVVVIITRVHEPRVRAIMLTQQAGPHANYTTVSPLFHSWCLTVDRMRSWEKLSVSLSSFVIVIRKHSLLIETFNEGSFGFPCSQPEESTCMLAHCFQWFGIILHWSVATNLTRVFFFIENHLHIFFQWLFPYLPAASKKKLRASARDPSTRTRGTDAQRPPVPTGLLPGSQNHLHPNLVFKKTCECAIPSFHLAQISSQNLDRLPLWSILSFSSPTSSTPKIGTINN